MAELGLENLTVTFGGAPILEGVSLQIERGERIGLLGRNGSGSAAVLRGLSGDLVPDGGPVVRRQGVRVAGLAQEVPAALPGTVAESLADALEEAGVESGWQADARTHEVVTQLGLDPDALVDTL